MQQKARTRRRRGFGLRGSEQELETIYFQLKITHEHDKTQPEMIKSTEKKKRFSMLLVVSRGEGVKSLQSSNADMNSKATSN